MSDLVVAIGLVLVIEGLLWSLFPGVGRKLLAVTAGTPESSLRMAGRCRRCTWRGRRLARARLGYALARATLLPSLDDLRYHDSPALSDWEQLR